MDVARGFRTAGNVLLVIGGVALVWGTWICARLTGYDAIGGLVLLLLAGGALLLAGLLHVVAFIVRRES